MSCKKLPILLVALLLKAGNSLAQSPPMPPVPPAPPTTDPKYQEVSVPVPRAVTLLADVTRVLLSRNEGKDKVQALMDRRKARSQKGEEDVTITVPKNRFTRALGLVD
ncbi:MAG: hypothetical protein JWR44_2611 [Hymenobacter sp.]|jgi:hypothetical protein|nr:hypothetical protein [Hymenobacter sp.]